MKDLLSLAELTASELSDVLGIAAKMKEERKKHPIIPLLSGKKLMAIFEKPSTRTRVSLEVAMFELGGLTISSSSTELQLGRGETVEDSARTLSRYVDVISARVFSHEKLVSMAKAATVPVINALSDLYHPLQTLADLLTIYECKGRLRGVKVAWIGDGNNVCNSLIIGASKVGMHLSIATPKGFEPHPEAVRLARLTNSKSQGMLEVSHEPERAVKNADVVMTDTFVSMGQEEEMDKRVKAFLPRFQVNNRLMREAKPDAIFMHCLPAKRGMEVEDAVIDGQQSVVFDQAENRLHTSKAILAYLLVSPEVLRMRLGDWPKIG
jgi:ornithine carbamoyltransferase